MIEINGERCKGVPGGPGGRQRRLLSSAFLLREGLEDAVELGAS